MLLGVDHFVIAVGDLAAAMRDYAALGRGGGLADYCLQTGDLDADGVRFAIGPHALEFLQPRHGRGPIGQWVESRGPGPYAARLTGGPPGVALDPRLAHGARLSIG